jgi:hypothetical protein
MQGVDQDQYRFDAVRWLSHSPYAADMISRPNVVSCSSSGQLAFYCMQVLYTYVTWVDEDGVAQW